MITSPWSKGRSRVLLPSLKGPLHVILPPPAPGEEKEDVSSLDSMEDALTHSSWEPRLLPIPKATYRPSRTRVEEVSSFPCHAGLPFQPPLPHQSSRGEKEAEREWRPACVLAPAALSVRLELEGQASLGAFPRLSAAGCSSGSFALVACELLSLRVPGLHPPGNTRAKCTHDHRCPVPGLLALVALALSCTRVPAWTSDASR